MSTLKRFSCSCSSKKLRPSKERHLLIEFSYLDLSTCSRCTGTDRVIQSAINDLRKPLKETGFKISFKKIHIKNEKLARQHAFTSSPTVRINGMDICPAVRESRCSSCIDLCGTDVDCRDWKWNGKVYSAPPKGLILEAILRAAYDKTFGKQPDFKRYKLPANLKRFFAARSLTSK